MILIGSNIPYEIRRLKIKLPQPLLFLLEKKDYPVGRGSDWPWCPASLWSSIVLESSLSHRSSLVASCSRASAHSSLLHSFWSCISSHLFPIAVHGNLHEMHQHDHWVCLIWSAFLGTLDLLQAIPEFHLWIQSKLQVVVIPFRLLFAVLVHLGGLL